MQAIEGVLFEPVGCLAEFSAEPFLEIAARSFGRKMKTSKSGSRAYWHLLNLMESSGGATSEALELQAVDSASVYEDVEPALAELKAMGVRLIIASSLSGAAVARFFEKCPPGNFFDSVWTRDNAGGVKAVPLQRAIAGASLDPERVMYPTDTAEGLKAAKSAGVQAVLMMNDPDEARRLAMHDPSGGIVSLHELPDFIRLVAAENAKLQQQQ
jgi:phosphoglycolate phosphatase-like HAD superfamily hydrolase